MKVKVIAITDQLETGMPLLRRTSGIFFGALTCALMWCAPVQAAGDKKLSYAVGTGFYVTRDGHLITAYHVVSHCSGPISVHGQQLVMKANLVASEPEHDLALLKIVPNIPVPFVSQFRPAAQPLKIGEPVIVTGYPSESMNGEFVEFLTGDARITQTKSHIGDDSQFMFTYAAKSGYSGGPVLDRAGNVIGMTASATCTSPKCMEGFKKTFTMKASTVEEVEKLEATIAQHLDTNIAASSAVLLRFLEKNNIGYEQATQTNAPTTDRVNQIAQSIANVRCPSDETTLVQNSGVVKTDTKNQKNASAPQSPKN